MVKKWRFTVSNSTFRCHSEHLVNWIGTPRGKSRGHYRKPMFKSFDDFSGKTTDHDISMYFAKLKENVSSSFAKGNMTFLGMG